MPRTIVLLNAILPLLQLVSAEPMLPDTSELQPYSPFFPFSPAYSQNNAVLLLKRQSPCPADHTSCSSLGAAEACCPSGTNCARDQRGDIACCPVNNVCTGALGDGITSSTNLPQTSSFSGGYVGTVTVTSTAGVSGVQTTAPATITGNAEGGGSTVPNAYYPYTFLPTAFANEGVCSQYYASCQAASTSCFVSLGGVNGVTINGLTGGTTQAGSSGIVQASASSICSSLSQTACRGVQSTQCAQFGSTGGTVSGFVQNGRAARETGCAAIIYAAAVGAAAGAMGLVV